MWSYLESSVLRKWVQFTSCNNFILAFFDIVTEGTSTEIMSRAHIHYSITLLRVSHSGIGQHHTTQGFPFGYR